MIFKSIIYKCRPGGTEASCFSPQFGGSCFGKVNGCKDCNQVIFNFIPIIYIFFKEQFFTTFKYSRSVVEGEVVVLEEAAQAAGPVALLLDNYLLEVIVLLLYINSCLMMTILFCDLSAKNSFYFSQSLST